VADLNGDNRGDLVMGGGDNRTRVLRNTGTTNEGEVLASVPLSTPRPAPQDLPVQLAAPVPAADVSHPSIEEPPVLASASASAASECGPPSTTIPGPPPEIIRVGQPMPESWLRCYVWQDIQGQDYMPEAFESVERTSFLGYPVECWNAFGLGTEGLLLRILARGDQGRQHVRFTYRIQMDGDYINNCVQELIP
jgi:hypothetical protein